MFIQRSMLKWQQLPGWDPSSGHWGASLLFYTQCRATLLRTHCRIQCIPKVSRLRQETPPAPKTSWQLRRAVWAEASSLSHQAYMAHAHLTKQPQGAEASPSVAAVGAAVGASHQLLLGLRPSTGLVHP